MAPVERTHQEAARFAQMNSEYPAPGSWRFEVDRVVANTVSEAVSDVTVTPGSMTARAVSFFSVEASKITRIVEFWPESYAAPANRVHRVGDRVLSALCRLDRRREPAMNRRSTTPLNW
jgi:hypothetical protein